MRICKQTEKRAASIMLTAQRIVGNEKGHPARDGQYIGFSFKLKRSLGSVTRRTDEIASDLPGDMMRQGL
jgi:hypothetical protein